MLGTRRQIDPGNSGQEASAEKQAFVAEMLNVS
jgi:hypothetical protein